MSNLDILKAIFDHIINTPLVIYSGRVLVIFIGGYIANRLIRSIINRYLKESADLLKTKVTSFQFLKHATTTIVFLVTLVLVFYAIPTLRNIGITLFASAGVFAAVLGIASQQAFSNIISGIFIVIFKPFRVGDLVYIGIEHAGFVEDINLRHTIIKNFENRRIIIPNSVISAQTIVNSNITDDKTCIHLFLSITFDSDLEKAIGIIREEAHKHLSLRDYRTPEEIAAEVPIVMVRVMSFGEYAVNLRANIWADDPIIGFEMKTEINRALKKRFDAEGIQLAHPHRALMLKNKEDFGQKKEK